jgi:hypothetical protein
MSLPESQPNRNREVYFDSSESDLIMIEGPGDTTVRPRPPYVPRYAPGERTPKQPPPAPPEQAAAKLPEPHANGNQDAFADSSETQLIFIDGPGDTTIRPRPAYVPRYPATRTPPEQNPPPAPEQPTGD